MARNNSIGASEQDVDQLAALFRLLSDRTRLTILVVLAEGERNVGSLCEELKLPQPTVSHHLGLLKMNNVIGSRRSGKQIFYGVNGRIANEAAAMQIAVEKYFVRIGAK